MQFCQIHMVIDVTNHQSGLSIGQFHVFLPDEKGSNEMKYFS